MTDTPARAVPELTVAEGPSGGPVCRCRGAETQCAKGGHACALLMEGHPFYGATFGSIGTATLLVDLWIEGRLLPGHRRAVPKAGE